MVLTTITRLCSLNFRPEESGPEVAKGKTPDLLPRNTRRLDGTRSHGTREVLKDKNSIRKKENRAEMARVNS